MQSGKFVVKTKVAKVDRKKYERQETFREHDKMKHNDKAMLRAMREEEREDYGGFHINEGY